MLAVATNMNIATLHKKDLDLEKTTLSHTTPSTFKKGFELIDGILCRKYVDSTRRGCSHTKTSVNRHT